LCNLTELTVCSSISELSDYTSRGSPVEFY
jgi:hypothetical protein